MGQPRCIVTVVVVGRVGVMNIEYGWLAGVGRTLGLLHHTLRIAISRSLDRIEYANYDAKPS